MQDKGGDPPRITGPLGLIDQNCGQKGNGLYCNFDYLLDPSSTNDPADEWHAYWSSPASAEAARHGYCTTESPTRSFGEHRWSPPARFRPSGLRRLDRVSARVS